MCSCLDQASIALYIPTHTRACVHTVHGYTKLRLIMLCQLFMCLCTCYFRRSLSSHSAPPSNQDSTGSWWMYCKERGKKRSQ